MIGPWIVQFTLTNQPGTTKIEQLLALTIVDKGTGWPEFVVTRSKSSQQITILFCVVTPAPIELFLTMEGS
jgi:hypothetical protein